MNCGHWLTSVLSSCMVKGMRAFYNSLSWVHILSVISVTLNCTVLFEGRTFSYAFFIFSLKRILEQHSGSPLWYIILEKHGFINVSPIKWVSSQIKLNRIRDLKKFSLYFLKWRQIFLFVLSWDQRNTYFSNTIFVISFSACLEWRVWRWIFSWCLEILIAKKFITKETLRFLNSFFCRNRSEAKNYVILMKLPIFGWHVLQKLLNNLSNQ